LCGATGCFGNGALGLAVVATGLGLGVAFFTTPLGALWMGRIMGSKGAYGWALLGTVVGLAAGYSMAAIIGLASGSAQVTNSVLPYALLLSAPLGAALGLEFSSSRNEREAIRSAGVGLRLYPAVAAGPQGGLAGLSGQF
jgi:hypothetical protein